MVSVEGYSIAEYVLVVMSTYALWAIFVFLFAAQKSLVHEKIFKLHPIPFAIGVTVIGIGVLMLLWRIDVRLGTVAFVAGVEVGLIISQIRRPVQ